MVTYGNRSDLVEECIRPLIQSPQVSQIILVDNGSGINYPTRIKNNKVFHIQLGENEGSAGGYAIGIEKALALNADYVMLLDDDNKVIVDDLNRYLSWVISRSVECSAALRMDRPEFIAVAEGKEHKEISKNSYLDYSLCEKKQRERCTEQKLDYPLLNYYTYSGLVFKATLLDAVDLPNKDFFLYCDDYDFSYRLSKECNGIILNHDIKIEDIDKSWVAKNNDGHQFFVDKADKNRLYYSTRNRVYFERKYFVTNNATYIVNMLLLFAKLIILALFRSKSKVNSFSCIKLLFLATVNGWKGKLGK